MGSKRTSIQLLTLALSTLAALCLAWLTIGRGMINHLSRSPLEVYEHDLGPMFAPPLQIITAAHEFDVKNATDKNTTFQMVSKSCACMVAAHQFSIPAHATASVALSASVPLNGQRQTWSAQFHGASSKRNIVLRLSAIGLPKLKIDLPNNEVRVPAEADAAIPFSVVVNAYQKINEDDIRIEVDESTFARIERLSHSHKLFDWGVSSVLACVLKTRWPDAETAIDAMIRERTATIQASLRTSPDAIVRSAVLLYSAPPVTAEPAAVAFALFGRNHGRQHVSLHSAKPFSILDVKCDIGCIAVEYRPPASASPSSFMDQQLLVTCRIQKKQGADPSSMISERGMLTVRTDVVNQPVLEIPVVVLHRQTGVAPN